MISWAMSKIFLSPSDQFENTYAGGTTNEGEQMGLLAEKLAPILRRCGFEVKIVHRSTLANKCNQSDAWGADLHLPLHSNAFNGTVSGTRVMCMRTVEGQLGYEYSKKIFKQLDAVTPGTSSNISAQPQLYEIHAPQAPTVYVEVDFHDVPMVANWIVHNLDVIADAIAKGVCDCFGVKYKEGDTLGESEIYRVQVGAFKNRDYAEVMKAKLIAAGYPAFVVKSNQ